VSHPIHAVDLQFASQRCNDLVHTVELEDPVMAYMDSEQMRLMKVITNSASSIVWITSGGLLNGSKPEFDVVFGLSEALIIEQPSLRFFCVDVQRGAL
jgi:hypothetical protein